MSRKQLAALSQLPTAGSLSAELAVQIHDEWITVAKNSSASLDGFDPDRPLIDRLQWAAANNWLVGGALSRFSMKLQCSTVAQLMECVRYAARNGMYVAPELCCVDEAVSGRKVRRDGLDRMEAILNAKPIDVLLVFKVSRILRSAHKSVALIQENVVEEGIRAVSVSQNIDTADDKSWKILLYIHGVLDELTLTTIADHVYAGLVNLFREGWTTGALPVGYRRKEVPGA